MTAVVIIRPAERHDAIVHHDIVFYDVIGKMIGIITSCGDNGASRIIVEDIMVDPVVEIIFRLLWIICEPYCGPFGFVKDIFSDNGALSCHLYSIKWAASGINGRSGKDIILDNIV